MPEDQKCPICSASVAFSERYPQYVCDACFLRAADEDGRSLSFSNVSLSGGFAALYRIRTKNARATFVILTE